MEKIIQAEFEPGGDTALVGNMIPQEYKKIECMTGPKSTPEMATGHVEYSYDGAYNETLGYKLAGLQESIYDRDDASSTYSSDVPLLEPSKAHDEPLAEKFDKENFSGVRETEPQTDIYHQNIGAYINPSAENYFLYDRDDASTTYSSDVPLLESSKAHEEPLTENFDKETENILNFSDVHVRETESQMNIYHENLDGAYINPSAEQNFVRSQLPSYSSEKQLDFSSKEFEPRVTTVGEGNMIPKDYKEIVCMPGSKSTTETTNEGVEYAYDGAYHEALGYTLTGLEETIYERDDASSTYSSDVPLLEPSKALEEPLAEKVETETGNMLNYSAIRETEPQINTYHQNVEGAFIHPSAEKNFLPSQLHSLSSENDLESNVSPLTPNSLRQNILATLDECETVSHFPVDIDYVEVREVVNTPVHIIGACWEFGSVSSIHNVHRESFAFRSRTNTMDQQSYTGSRRDIYGGSNRLLARVFSNTIGSIEFGMKDSKELSMTFLPDIEPPIDEVFTEEKILCCSKNTKNVLVVSAGVTLLFVSLFGLTNLQSSMNSEGGLGVYSMALSFLAFLLGSLFSTVIVKRYRPKVCLIFGCLSPLFYVLVQFKPSFALFIPASFILGLSKAILWNAVSTYITEVGLDESARKRKLPDNVICKYYGMFFLSLQLAFVFGNLISSLVLVPPPSENFDRLETLNMTNSTANGTSGMDFIYEDNYTETKLELSLGNIDTTSICGSGYCNSLDKKGSQTFIDDTQKTILLLLYSLCIILSTVIMLLFLDHLPNYTTTYTNVRAVSLHVKNVLKMFTDGQFLLIVMLCLYTMICNGFVVADVLKAYVTCPLGIHMVGYTMICFGLTGAASSYIAGKLIKHTGRTIIYIFAMVLNVGSLIWMMTWNPTTEDTNTIFVLMGIWGVAEGIWQSQINSLITAVFADRYEEAFGACRLLQGLAGIVVFTLSENLCMMAKIIITMTTCILGVALYIIMEILRKICPRQEELRKAQESG